MRLRRTLLLLLVLMLAAVLGAATPALAASTGGSGGPFADRTFLNFTGADYVSQYHLYAARLDTAKPIGLLVYADGSGDYGLQNPSASYALGGPDGVIAVAKRHNMVLLAPFSPNRSCRCWEQGDPTGYADQ